MCPSSIEVGKTEAMTLASVQNLLLIITCDVSFVDRLAGCSSSLLLGLRLSGCGAAVVIHGLLQIGEATDLIESPGLAGMPPILGDCGGVSVGWLGMCALVEEAASC